MNDKRALKKIVDFLNQHNQLLKDKNIPELYRKWYWQWFGDGQYLHFNVKGNPLTIVLKEAGINPLQYVTTIPNCYAAFSNDTELLRIPSHIKIISTSAYSQSTVENIICAEGLEEIHADAFYGCKELSKVILPKSLSTIEEGAFDDCTYLHTVIYRGTKEEASKIKGIFNTFIGCPDGLRIECSDGTLEI